MTLTIETHPRQTGKTMEKIVKMHQAGAKMQDIADALNVKLSIVSDVIRKYNLFCEKKALREVNG